MLPERGFAMQRTRTKPKNRGKESPRKRFARSRASILPRISRIPSAEAAHQKTRSSYWPRSHWKEKTGFWITYDTARRATGTSAIFSTAGGKVQGPTGERTFRRPLSDQRNRRTASASSFRGLSVRVRETPWLVCGSPVLVAPRVAEISHSASAKLKPQAQSRLRARGRPMSIPAADEA
jgi:hypothetical protein